MIPGSIRARAIAVLCTAAAVVVPATAQAAPDFTVDFRLPADRGVHVQFQASGGSFDGALLGAYRFDRRWSSSSTYFKTGAGAERGIAQDEIDLDFGRRGRIEAAFEETRRNRIHVPGCRGYYLIRRGAFTGTMRFRGEAGYAVTRARHVLGHVYVDNLHGCRSGGGGYRQPKSIVLSSCRPGGPLEYDAMLVRKYDLAIHFAQEWDRQAGLLVVRNAVMSARPRSFEASDSLAGAIVRPGGPFKGSAVLRHGRLTGDLQARLLGHRRPQDLTPAPGRLTVRHDGLLGGCVDPPEELARPAYGRGRAAGLSRIAGVPSPANPFSFAPPELRRLLHP